MTHAVVGVIGAGTMGAGIAQVALEAGDEVVLYDVDEVARDRGRERIAAGLAKRAAKLDLTASAAEAWVEERLTNLRHAHTLEAIGSEAGLRLVVEAALESLELKRDVFRILDDTAEPDVILATNTSALSITAIAEACDAPERVVGLHFFNPAPVMRLVEVVAGESTDDAVVDEAVETMERWGKTPIRCTDAPGFIVNRVNRPFTIEALRILEAGEATIVAIDGSMRNAGFPLGPFELMDLTGIDVTTTAATAIWERLGRPERLQPSAIQRRLIAEERLGRKSGAGFYEYATGRPEHALELPPTPGVLPWTGDRIVQRIRASILAEARLARDEGVASESDIDLALVLGAAHPEGPFAWGRATGA